MSKEQEKEHAEKLKQGAKELIDGIGIESELDQRMEYKNFLIKLLDELSEKSIRRLYNLAEYLYIYKEG